MKGKAYVKADLRAHNCCPSLSFTEVVMAIALYVRWILFLHFFAFTMTCENPLQNMPAS